MCTRACACTHTHTHTRHLSAKFKMAYKPDDQIKNPPLCFQLHFNTLIWNGINWRLAISQHDTDKMSYLYIQLLCHCKINCYFFKILQYKKQLRYKMELYGIVRNVQSVQFSWS